MLAPSSSHSPLPASNGRVGRWFTFLAACALTACGGGSGGSGAGAGGGSSAIVVDADLVGVSLSVAETVIGAGMPINVVLRARNLGPAAVPAFRLGVYLSADDAFDGADRRLGFWGVTGLAAGAETSAAGSLAVPVSTLTGIWRVLLVVDDLGALTELDETNNVTVAPMAIMVEPPILPNLMPASLSFLPFSVQAGTTLQVSDSVQNNGAGAAGAFRVGVYLSSDPTISTADVLIGFRTLIDLPAGARDDAQGELTVPVTLTPGNYHVGVMVDDLQQVLEVSENDNVASAAVLVQVLPAPDTDIVAASLSFAPSSVQVGAALTIDESVRNEGSLAAGAFQVAVYLSQDATIDPLVDVLLGSRALTSLAGGATSASGSVALPVPTNLQAGDWFVGLVADPNGALLDPNRSNNTFIAPQRVQLVVPPLPDLVAASLSFSPNSIQPGGGNVIQVDELVENVGPVEAGAFRVAVYLSDNAVISSSDVLLGSRGLGSLPSGGSSGASNGFVVPGGLSPGTYYVGLVVDDLGQLTELSEANNLRLATSTLDVTTTPNPMPNLVMEEVTPGSSQTQPGAVMQVVSRVKNIGTASASGSFRVGFYLSLDPVITTDDIFIGDRLIPFGLGIGFTSVASVPVTIPNTLAPGTYRFGAFADWGQLIAESVETDNGRAATAQFVVSIPRPNLRVTAVTASATGPIALGASFDVDHAVRNAGAVAAGGMRVGIYLSTDAVLDRAVDVLVASRIVSALAVSTNSAEVTTVTVPTTLAPGSYRVGVYVDDLDAVLETDETDNTRVTTTAITVQ